MRAPFVEPRLVAPGELQNVPDNGGVLGRGFKEEPVGVGLQNQRAAGILDFVFVERAFANARNEQLPNAGRTEMPHRMKPAVPTVEVADHTDPLRVRRPDRETGARHTVDDAQF